MLKSRFLNRNDHPYMWTSWLAAMRCTENDEEPHNERFLATSFPLSRACPDASWAHARRKLYELAALGKAPIAVEAVRRIDRLFAVEHDIAGLSAEARLAVRRERSAPILAELEPWLRQQQERLSRKSEVGKAIAYTTRRWEALTRFMGDGRICMSNNAAERALRGVAVGRRNWTFAGSDRGGERAAAIYTLIETAKLGGIDPQAWLADVLARLPDHPARWIGDLLPWNWASSARSAAPA